MTNLHKIVLFVIALGGVVVLSLSTVLHWSAKPQKDSTTLILDPIDDDPKYQAVIREVESEVDEKLKDVPKRMGFCHHYWAVKKEILKEKHGIDWKTPAELNKHIAFD